MELKSIKELISKKISETNEENKSSYKKEIRVWLTKKGVIIETSWRIIEKIIIRA